MISKEGAIDILDKYFELGCNIDPLHSIKLKPHRLYIEEKDLFWILVQCAEEDILKKEGNIGGIGGGVYYIDKENGEIFAIGSAPFYNWELEFINFKKGLHTEISWAPLKNSYLECKSENTFKIEFEEVKIKCNYLEKEKAVRDYFQKNHSSIHLDFNPKLINKAFDSVEGELILGINGMMQNQSTNLVVKQFKGGLSEFSPTLWDLKKWLRINNKKGTDNYWIEIQERNFEEQFDKWQLKLNMEYK